ncbi:MAG: hypothetical protein LBS91_10135 [Clostridiales Family XIII bacterium]|jgi:hypothetical protein|nr:hypothetical protein [Clostridiales Family XIII bacterium]
MGFVDDQLKEFKRAIEESIISAGVKGKDSIIRSSGLINLIHDAVKHELIVQGVNPENVYPRLYETKPEINLVGFFKQKYQDICVLPSNIEKIEVVIDWGPLGYLNKVDPYGSEFSRNALVINVRSQMSSLAKNADTLFERTIAESHNLHIQYPDIVLGEVYLIPINEYDEELVKEKTVGFKDRKTDIERYITFFNSLNNRRDIDSEEYGYERCALLIVDFSREEPYLYNCTADLIQNGLVAEDFQVELETLSFRTFARDILAVYAARHNLKNLT